MSVSRYGAYIFVRCFVILQVAVENLLKITYWQAADYEHVFIAHRERRAAVQRRVTQWSQRKGEELKYLLPKGEEIAVGVKEKLREHVREHALLQAGPDPQLLSLKPIG